MRALNKERLTALLCCLVVGCLGDYQSMETDTRRTGDDGDPGSPSSTGDDPTGTGSSDGSGTGGTGDEAPPTGGADAEEFYAENVHSVLQIHCATCHAGSNPGDGSDFLGPDPAADSYRMILLANTMIVGDRPENSLLILQDEHTGPGLTDDQKPIVSEWIELERSGDTGGDTGGDSGGDSGDDGTPDPGGDPEDPMDPTGTYEPGNLTEALERFGACMELAVWDEAEMYRVANQNTLEGPCYSCHGGGTAGAFLSANGDETFRMNRVRPYVLKLVTGTVNPDGSFDDLVPSERMYRKGEEAEECEDGTAVCHPRYFLSESRRAAVDEFVDRTLERFRDYEDSCGME